MSAKDGGPAFPSQQLGSNGDPVSEGVPGMSTRAYIATAALQGFLADSSQRLINEAIQESPHAHLLNDSVALSAAVNAQLAAGCCALADALIAELEKP